MIAPDIREAPFCVLDPITPMQVLAAWASFAKTTVLEATAFGLLKSASQALATLVAALLTSCEVAGAFPSSLQRVYVALLAKPAGGLRPIQLCPSLVRTWHRIRRC